MDRKENENLVTVRGIIVPLMWAEDGSITAVGISSFDESDFLLSTPDTLSHWVSLLRKEVEVVGIVSRSSRGLKAVTVSEYRCLEKGEANEAP